MAAEVTLVQDIQKYPCLYNNNLPEYNRKDLTEEAWMDVANSNNLTVSECKEKWRNIRCSFLRSLRPGTKYKKPYYLTAYLQFVLPFMKSINTSDTVEDSQTNEASKYSNTKEIVISAVKSEPEDFDQLSGEESVSIPVTTSETINSDPIVSHQQPSALRRRRRPIPAFSRTFAEKKLKRLKNSEGHLQNSVSADGGNISATKYFLLSLLPEFETMSEEQVRLFKIKVMLLIDELKINDTHIRRSINGCTEANRLHKRLINLLLKNIKKTHR